MQTHISKLSLCTFLHEKLEEIYMVMSNTKNDTYMKKTTVTVISFLTKPTILHILKLHYKIPVYLYSCHS